MRIRIPYSTLVIFLATVTAYFFLSGGELFIPVESLSWLGFSLNNLAGALSYSFIHISIVHLFGNMLAFLIAGIIVERYIGSAELALLYLLCAVVSAAIYLLFFPNVVLIGASGAVAGIIFAGFLFDIRKMVLFSVGAVLIISGIVEPFQTTIYGTRTTELEQEAVFFESLMHNLSENVSRLEEKETELHTELVDIESKINQTEEVINETLGLFEEGNISETEYNQTLENLTVLRESLETNMSVKEEEAENVSQTREVLGGQVSETNESLGETVKKKSTLVGGKEREEVTGVSHLLHLMSSLICFGYLRIKQRKLVIQSLRRYSYAVWKFGDSVRAFRERLSGGVSRQLPETERRVQAQDKKKRKARTRNKNS